MNKAYIVVGAGYGDEGKGLTVDWLCNQLHQQAETPVVVRANGGCQAAHTVQTPDGERHVFHSHGSGSLLGARTYHGPQFLLNPIGWREERHALAKLNCHPEVYYSPECPVTLPVDMMLNEAAETHRGSARHGSCAWGIGETVERGLRDNLRVVAADLPELSLDRLRYIRDAWYPQRVAMLGLPLSTELHKSLTDDGVLERWMRDAHFLLNNARQLEHERVLELGSALVCEGAQGLGLDQNNGHFPYVTRSNTGCLNAAALCADAGVEQVELVYVSRIYNTRHGAGPLEHEGEASGCAMDDPTNIPNEWQGALRHAPLELELLAARVGIDAAQVFGQWPQAQLSCMVTCLDQVGAEGVRVLAAEGWVQQKPDFVAGRILQVMQMSTLQHGGNPSGGRLLVSRGPTRATVTENFKLDKSIRDIMLAALESIALEETLDEKILQA